MARVLITGSTDGLGLMTAQSLVAEGHEVTLHARSETRAQQVSGELPGASNVIIGDLSSIAAITGVADQANAIGRYDSIIHNAGIGYREANRVETIDGLSQLFVVNVLAPFLLTALITPPSRLVYLGSGMHRGGNPDLSDLQWTRKPWSGPQAYSDSKFFDLVLALAVARHWTHVLSNAVDPGWVPTKMGGPGAPDDINLGTTTQVWLATSHDPAANATGQYFYHQRPIEMHPAASSHSVQDGLLAECAALTGVTLP